MHQTQPSTGHWLLRLQLLRLQDLISSQLRLAADMAVALRT
jgi:hypothetical protein